jgi:hypothetical protein
MSSLGYSDFNDGGGLGTVPKRSTGADDGYIATKRKNKTIKSFDMGMNGGGGSASGGGGADGSNSANTSTAPVNPKLERLKQSIAKIHMASSDDEDDEDAVSNPSKTKTNMLPSYPGQGMGHSVTAPPIADAGSGLTSSNSPLPPTTAEGRTHQPMFSLSQQTGAASASGGGVGGGGVEHFGVKMPSTYAAQYYKQFVPYNRMSNELSSAGANSDELLEKLNYIVHMLEEQHNERTEHVAEELVLYCFLGVFIIFIVDSFARAGKYTR